MVSRPAQYGTIIDNDTSFTTYSCKSYLSDLITFNDVKSLLYCRATTIAWGHHAVPFVRQLAVRHIPQTFKDQGASCPLWT